MMMEETLSQVLKIVMDQIKKWFLSLPRYLQKTWVLGGIGFSIIFFAALAYILRFGWFPLGKHEEWGQFGDFLGGTTNPILAFLTFIGVLWTIGLNHEELAKAATAEEEDRKSKKKEDIQRIITAITAKIDTLLASNVEYYPIIIAEGGEPLCANNPAIAPLADLLLNETTQAVILKNVFIQYSGKKTQFSMLFKELKRYLILYDKLTDIKASYYYRTIYGEYVYRINLVLPNTIDEETYEYMKDVPPDEVLDTILS